jgi:mRNA interferase MazF
MPEPSRGEIWLIKLGPTQGHEQAGKRLGLVMSVDLFNHGPAGIVVIIPMTTIAKGIPFHVGVEPPEGGLDRPSFIKCEDIRSITKARLVKPLGKVTEDTLAEVEDRLRILLDL